MTPRAIISYDDTPGDFDALTLGRILADAGAALTLAYVRHRAESERSRELMEEDVAQELLDRGARRLNGLHVERRVVVSASTAEGLKRLAEQEEADIVVFGSEYRTAAGHVSPQQSTRTLLDGGPTAVAIAPAGYRTDRAPRIHRVGIWAVPGDDATVATARDLAENLGASVTRDEHEVDLLVVGSRLEAPRGRVMVSAQAENEIENATCPVLVVPHGTTVHFPASVLARAA
jgi:nucleotide-binding universal stress UspA family protein